MDKKVLLVEGPNDELFFSKFCINHGYDVHVKVKKPSSVTPGNPDNKQGVLQLLQVYIKLLAPNSVEKLGVIVDADYLTTGGGVQTTLNQIHDKIREHGYTSEAKQSSDSSYYFEKDDLNLSAKVHKLTIDKEGNINQNWPKGFFDEFRNKLDELIW